MRDPNSDFDPDLPCGVSYDPKVCAAQSGAPGGPMTANEDALDLDGIDYHAERALRGTLLLEEIRDLIAELRGLRSQLADKDEQIIRLKEDVDILQAHICDLLHPDQPCHGWDQDGMTGPDSERIRELEAEVQRLRGVALHWRGEALAHSRVLLDPGKVTVDRDALAHILEYGVPRGGSSHTQYDVYYRTAGILRKDLRAALSEPPKPEGTS